MHGIQRRWFLIAAVALVAAPFAAVAQQASRIPRIGYLGLNRTAAPRILDAFYKGLRDLGYVDGSTVVIEYRDAEGKPERLPALAAELVALKVDVILAPTTLAALAAKRATSTIPIVFSAVFDPVMDGLVTSLARPGGNVTGLASLTPELVGKRMELLTQAVPGIRRVAILRQSSAVIERTEMEMLNGAKAAASALGVKLQLFETHGREDFDRAFSEMAGARAGGLLLMGGSMFFSERRRLVDLAARYRLPAVHILREFVDDGGLMSYGRNEADSFRRAADYVDRILKGARPGDLPVEQPTKFDLVINLKTARSLGITIPRSVLGRADEVIR